MISRFALLLAAPAFAAEYIDVAAKAGLAGFVNRQGSLRKDFIVESIGGGAAWIDYDSDGWIDAVLVRGHGPVCALFRNNRDGTFTDVTLKAGITAPGWGMGVSVADFNGDGHDDFLVTGYGRNFLFRNRGDGTFEEVAARAGVLSANLWSTGAAFFDADKDGDLDLYVARYVRRGEGRTPRSPQCKFQGLSVFCGPQGMRSDPHAFFRNQNGMFREAPLPKMAGPRHGLGVIVLDYNNDGLPDIYVACDSTANVLWNNKGGGNFEDVAVEAGVAFSSDGLEQASMGVDAGDLFNRALTDLFVTNFSNEPFELYRQRDPGSYEDITWNSVIGKVTLPFMGWSTHFADLDLDGRLDIIAVNGHIYPEVGAENYRQKMLAFRNLGDGRFEEAALGLPPASGRGAAVGDYDNDGDLDLLVNNMDAPPLLLQAARSPSRNWLTVSLAGQNIGARVIVRAAGIQQTRDIRSQSGYLSSSDRRAHFGLGDATEAEVEVQWPDGSRTPARRLKANQMVLLRKAP